MNVFNLETNCYSVTATKVTQRHTKHIQVPKPLCG